MITVRSPKGREVRVSDKLFVSVYRSQGYRLLSDPVIVPADQVPVAIGGDYTELLPAPDQEPIAEGSEAWVASASPGQVLVGDGGPEIATLPDDDGAIFALALDGSGELGPLPSSLAARSRNELNAYAESIGVLNPASVSNKGTLLNLIGAHLREQPEG